MEDLHAMFDSMVGFLVGMTLMEVVVKPSLIRFGKSSLKAVDRDASVPDWVVPDWLYEDPAESELQEPPFDR
jgi:hypothetical protein